MYTELIEDLTFLRWNIFSPYKDIFNTGVTTRKGGYSDHPFSSFNLGLHCGDKDERVLENRKKLCTTLGTDFSCFTCAEQTHGTNTSRVEVGDIGRGHQSSSQALANTDILITDQLNALLIILTADCVPIVLFDPVKKVFAVVHCGWKGTALGGVIQAVNQLKLNYNSISTEILVGIGPAIEPQFFEVSTQTRELILNMFSYSENIVLKKSQINLVKANKLQLESIGVLTKNIETMPLGTFSNSDILFSYRRDKKITGRQATFAILQS